MEKYCRFLLATLSVFAISGATVYAQPYHGATRGDVYATSWQTGRQGPIPLGSGYTSAVPVPVPQQFVVQVSAPPLHLPPSDLPKETKAASIETSVIYIPQSTAATPEPKSASQPVVSQIVAAEEPAVEPEPEDEMTYHSTHRHSRFEHSRWFRPVGSSIPNMIGDSTSMPKRLLTYSFMGTDEVLVPNPNYVPWPENQYTDIPLGSGSETTDTGTSTGSGSGLNVNDDLLPYVPKDETTGTTSPENGNTGTSNTSKDEYLVTYETSRKTMAVPMAVTPTMYITSLNVAENFNADAQDRFYMDLRFLGGGDSFGYAKSAGGVFTSKTDLSRITFGIEKKITDNQSIELRLPLVLVGLKSSQKLGGNDKADTATEFGNLSVVYKNTWRRTAEAAFCWGVGLNAPTAPGIKLNYEPLEGANVISGKIDNKMWNIVPYVGFEWNRNNETFGHLVAQLDFAVNDNRLEFTDHKYGLTRYRTDLSEYSLLRFNIGTGRWIYENPYNASQFKLGIMAEVHYTTNVNVVNPKTVRSNGLASDNYFVYSPGKRNWSSVNLIFGIPMVTRWTSLTTFVGVPVTSARSYDIEGGISADVRF